MYYITATKKPKHLSGFIDKQGNFTALDAGITHNIALYNNGETIEGYLSKGGCRVKVYYDRLTVESTAGLTKKQRKAVIKMISNNKYHTLYIGNKGREIYISAFAGVKVWHFVKALQSRKKCYQKDYFA